MTSTEEELIRQAAKEILVLNAEIAELTERRDRLKSHFKDADTYPPGKYDLGDTELVVSTNQRISEKKAKTLLSADRLLVISVPKVDSKKARAMLTDRELESIMDHYDHRVEVRLKDGSNHG